MQATSDDSLDDVESHCMLSVYPIYMWAHSSVLTPVGDNGLEALELGCALHKRGELQALELGRDCVGHGGRMSRELLPGQSRRFCCCSCAAPGRPTAHQIGVMAGILVAPCMPRNALGPAVARWELQSMAKGQPGNNRM